MAKIPFATSRVQASDVTGTAPRADRIGMIPIGTGSISPRAAAAPWEALAKAGDDISGLGQMAMRLGEKQVQQENSTAGAVYEGLKSQQSLETKTLIEKNTLAKIPTSPEQFDAINKKYDELMGQTLGRMTKGHREKYDVDFEFHKQGVTASVQSYFNIKKIEENTAQTAMSHSILLNDGKFDEAKAIRESAVEWAQPSTIIAMEKAEVTARERLENAQKDTLVSGLLVNKQFGEVDKIAETGTYTDEFGTVHNFSKIDIAEMQSKQVQVKHADDVSTATFNRDNAVAMGDFKTISESHKEMAKLGVAESVIAKSYTAAVFNHLKIDKIQSVGQLQTAEASFEAYAKEMPESEKAVIQRYFNANRVQLKNDAASSLQATVNTKNPDAVEAMRPQLVDTFGEKAGNLLADQGVLAANLGQVTTASMMADTDDIVPNDTSVAAPVYAAFTEKINDLKTREFYLETKTGPHVSRRNAQPFAEAAKVFDEIAESPTLSLPQKDQLLSHLNSKLVPASASPDQVIVNDMRNMTIAARGDLRTKSPEMWMDFSKTAERIAKLQKSGDMAGVEKESKAYSDRLTSVKTQIAVVESNFGSVQTLKNAINNNTLERGSGQKPVKTNTVIGVRRKPDGNVAAYQLEDGQIVEVK